MQIYLPDFELVVFLLSLGPSQVVVRIPVLFLDLPEKNWSFTFNPELRDKSPFRASQNLNI